MNLDNIGISTVKDSTAFKKIQFFSKTNPTNLFNVKSDFQNSFNKINKFYTNDLELNQSYTYGIDRQHTFTALSSLLPMSTTLIDPNSVDKFFSYNLGKTFNQTNSDTTSLNRFNYSSSSQTNEIVESLINTYNKVLPNKLTNINLMDFSILLKIPNIINILGAENDSKQYSNTFKFLLNPNYKKKSIQNFNFILSDLNNNDYNTVNVDPTNTFTNNLYNTENTLKFKDYKSQNAQFLGSERTPRLLTNLNSNSYKWNTSAASNTTSSLSNTLLNYGTSQNYLYSTSLSHWPDVDKHIRHSGNRI
jgi:hypothetical protein